MSTVIPNYAMAMTNISDAIEVIDAFPHAPGIMRTKIFTAVADTRTGNGERDVGLSILILIMLDVYAVRLYPLYRKGRASSHEDQ